MRQPAKRRPRPSRQWQAPRNPKEREQARERIEAAEKLSREKEEASE